MILLKKIELNNFFSHSKTEIDFNNDTRVLIDGKSGCGKSSIIEAIIWCLYGKARVDNRSIIKRGENYASVILILSDGNIDYKIERRTTKTGSQNIAIFSKKSEDKTFKILDINGNRIAQEYIEKDLIKSSYLLFINSAVYPQDNSDNFIKQSASKKKDLLLEMINSHVFDDYLLRVKNKLSEYESLIMVSEAELSSIESEIKTSKEIIDLNINAENDLLITSNNIKESELSLEKITTEIALIENSFREKERLGKEINEIEKKILEKNDNLIHLVGEAEKNKNNLNSVKNELSLVDSDKIKKEILEIETQEEKLSVWKANIISILNEKPSERNFDKEIADTNKQIINLMQNKIDTCPEIDKPCPIVKRQNDQQVKFWSERLSQLKDEKDDYVEKITLFLNKKEGLGEEPIVSGDKNSLKLMLDEISEKNKTLLEAENKQKSIENEIKSETTVINHLKEQKMSLRRNFEPLKTISEDDFNNKNKIKINLKKELELLNNQRAGLSGKIMLRDSLIKKVSELSDKIKNNKEKIKDDIKIRDGLKKLKDIFGNNGLKSMVIDQFIPLFEDNINNVLSSLSDFRVKIDTQRGSVSGDSVIEGLFITVINDVGEEMAFDNYSGGEKLKITVAICEALSSIQRVGFRVLDELFVGIDDESINSFAEIISSLKSNFSQLICISHLGSIKELFDEKILVKKQNGTSTITKQYD